MTTTSGDFVWYDLLTTDPQAAAEFYAQVIGWTAEPATMVPGHIVFSSAQGPVAGVTALPETARRRGPFWSSDVRVDDVDATVARAVELGGRALGPARDLPGLGRMAVIADPQGAPISVFQPADPRPGHDPARPAEVVWRELLTSDHRAAFAFHGQLFGWTTVREVEIGRVGTYLVYGHHGRELGGMFTRAPEMPAPMWFYYFGVENLEAAIERATARGGKLMNGPMPVPGGARIAQLADPQGAMFALQEPPKRP
jgi:predicted enzyme related to lactoylglutathione lyase